MSHAFSVLDFPRLMFAFMPVFGLVVVVAMIVVGLRNVRQQPPGAPAPACIPPAASPMRQRRGEPRGLIC